MKKRLLCIIALMLAAAMIAGCGAKPSSDEKSPAPAGESAAPDDSPASFDTSTVQGWGEAVKAKSDGKTITVAMASHPSTEAFQTMADAFTELTGIQVVWDIVEETNL